MGPAPERWRFLRILLIGVGLLVLYVGSPFAEALLLAAVLAATFHPFQQWLAKRLGQRPSLATALVVAGVVVALVVPTAIFVTVLVQQTIGVAQAVVGMLQEQGIDGLLAHLPHRLQAPAHRLLVDTPEARTHLQSGVAYISGWAVSIATGFLQSTGKALIQIVAMLIALYMLLMRGRQFRTWLVGLSPLGPVRTGTLLDEMRRVSISVFGSTVVTAAVQSVVALAGYAIARVPNAVLLAFLTFFVALVPALGATVFVIVVAAVELATGHVTHGFILAGWAVLVSVIAQVLQPLFITRQGGSKIDGGVMLFALLGGTAVFGAMGLIVGPLAVALLLALTRMYEEERLATVSGRPPPSPYWRSREDVGLPRSTLPHPPHPPHPPPPARR